MKIETVFLTVNSIVLAIFAGSVLVYALSSVFAYLLALVFFSFNPVLIFTGIWLFILDGSYPVSVPNKLLPYLGMLGVNSPALVATKILPDVDGPVALIIVGCGMSLILCLLMILTMYRGVRRNRAATERP